MLGCSLFLLPNSSLQYGTFPEVLFRFCKLTTEESVVESTHLNASSFYFPTVPAPLFPAVLSFPICSVFSLYVLDRMATIYSFLFY